MYKKLPHLTTFIIAFAILIMSVPRASAQTQCEKHLEYSRVEHTQFINAFKNDKDPKMRQESRERFTTLDSWINQRREEGQTFLVMDQGDIQAALAENLKELVFAKKYGGHGVEHEVEYNLCNIRTRISQLEKQSSRLHAHSDNTLNGAERDGLADRYEQWNRCGNALYAELGRTGSLLSLRPLGGDKRLDFGIDINQYCGKWMKQGYTFERPQTKSVIQGSMQVSEPRLAEDEPCPFVEPNKTSVGYCSVLIVKSQLDFHDRAFQLRQSLVRGFKKEQCFEYQSEAVNSCFGDSNISYCVSAQGQSQCLNGGSWAGALWDPRKVNVPIEQAKILYRESNAGTLEANTLVRVSGIVSGSNQYLRNTSVKARECKKPSIPTDFLEPLTCLTNNSRNIATKWSDLLTNFK